MSSFKDIAKTGWKPKINDGKLKERIRKDFKGIDQVAGWIGKGKESSLPNGRPVHPISSLTDPSTFEPPPKKVDYGPQLTVDKTEPVDTGRSRPSPRPYIRGSNPAILSSHKLQNQESPLDRATKPCPPKLPPRANTNPAMLHPEERDPNYTEGLFKKSPSSTTDISDTVHRDPVNKFANTLRQSHILPPPTSHSTQNQSNSAHLTSLLSHKSESTSQGTSFAQKRATLKTANSLWKDPSSVSLSDARAAASTANNFRERHGSQIKSGWQLAQNVDQKYAISEKISTAQHASEERGQSFNKDEAQVQNKDQPIKKRPPPPPPPVKRLDLVSSKTQPPPIPKATKPKF
ncbi:hypothetical protein K3495_g7125 [Podosphaera aphanis]|nr:hypothetical protein K3495_g7125 [Podosphaera aphanis]